MRQKLFTPVNFGAFDLRHRLVVDWGRSVADEIAGAGRAPVAISAGELSGGFVIHDPGAFACSDASTSPSAPNAPGERIWCVVIEAAQLARQVTVARLAAPRRGNGAHDSFERILANHVVAARRARSSGFDRIELDAGAGSVMDRSSRRREASAVLSADDFDFFDDLLQALLGACGRERVGVRFAPFRRGGSLARGPVLDQAVRSAHEREIAYVQIVEAKPAARGDARAIRLPLTAQALRRALPGAFIASGGSEFARATALVENRWVDAYCFQTDLLQLERGRLA